LVILNRNPVASALFLVVSFGFMAGLFVLLNAYFLAAIQILVYAGAIMVLFLFIIMLLDLKAAAYKKRSLFSYFFGAVVALALALLFIQMLPGQNPAMNQLPAADNAYDARALGKVLFTQHLLPFLATGVLLLTSTAGVVLLSKRGIGSDASEAKPEDPTK